MRNALVIGMDESLEVVDLDASEGSLKVLQNAVEGYVQAIDLKRDLTMWANEEGKLEGMMTNSIATAIFQTRFGMVDIIVGNAVLTGGTDDEGETIGLTDEQVTRLKFLFTK
jgi:hypothetical protein